MLHATGAEQTRGVGHALHATGAKHNATAWPRRNNGRNLRALWHAKSRRKTHVPPALGVHVLPLHATRTKLVASAVWTKGCHWLGVVQQ